MKYCTRCGAPNDDDAVFCTGCGASLKPKPARTQQDTAGDQAVVGQDDDKLKKKRIILIGAAVAVVLVLFGVYYYMQRSSSSSTQTLQSASSSSSDSGKNSVSSDSGSSSDSSSSSSSSAKKETTHSYTVVIKDVTWDQAQSEAVAAGGYLCRIDQEGEFEKVVAQAENQGASNGKLFIGGKRFSGSDSYYWVDAKGNKTGSSLNSSSNWLTGDPSYTDTDPSGNTVQEDKMAIFYYDNGGKWVWADVPNNILQTAPEYSGKIGYIIEKDS